MWSQQSRTNWLADRDHNTRYYHMKIARRRRKNKILMLNNDYGIWMKEESELKRHANDYGESGRLLR